MTDVAREFARRLTDPNACGVAYSLAPSIAVYCDLGQHYNSGYHEGPLADSRVWRVRWASIGMTTGPAHPQLVRKEP